MNLYKPITFDIVIRIVKFVDNTIEYSNNIKNHYINI